MGSLTRAEVEPKLLVSRLAVTSALHDLSEAERSCAQLADCVSRSVKRYGSSIAERSAEAHVLGWMNLFVEGCRRNHNRKAGGPEERCGGFSPFERLVLADDFDLAPVLNSCHFLLANSRDSGSPILHPQQEPQAWDAPHDTTGLRDPTREFDPKNPDEGFSSHSGFKRLVTASKAWDEALAHPEKRERLLSEIFHTAVMHLLEIVLDGNRYRDGQSVKERAVVNVLLVPLMRACFSCPDRSHVVYAKYHHGSSEASNDFHLLYLHNIDKVETFKSITFVRRSEVLDLIKKKGCDFSSKEEGNKPVALPEDLRERFNWIVHGAKTADLTEGTLTSGDVHDNMSRKKKTAVCQLSLLLHNPYEADGQTKSGKRQYRAFLHHTGYLRPDSDGGWAAMQDERREEFAKALHAEYADGYADKTLGKLFHGDASTRPFPVWFSDGEVSFLWLLEGCTSSPPRIPKDLRLFNSDGTPTDKAWALVTFLERAQYGRPEWLWVHEKRPNALLNGLYLALLRADRLNETTFTNALKQVANEFAGKLPRPADVARLESYHLEKILRRGEPHAYTLFFLPLSLGSAPQRAPSDRSDAVQIPTIFLAGTFAGFEGRSYPFVTLRHDYHAFAVLDAIRPIVDHEIGRFMRFNQDRFEVEVAGKRAAEDREKTVRAVLPAAERLSTIFREAIGQVLQIEAAVDLDWSGLFGRAMRESIARFFGDKPLTMPAPERYRIECRHEIPLSDVADDGAEASARSFLWCALLYLVREGNLLQKKLKKQQLTPPAEIPVPVVEALSSTPFLQLLLEHPVGTGRPSAIAAARLLKLLAVDSADANKGVHILQLAAALDMLKPRDGTKVETKVVVDRGPGHASRVYEDRPFTPETDTGLENLCDALVYLGDFDKGDVFVRLRSGIVPALFLRSLRGLVHGPLRPRASAPDVQLRRWELRYDHAQRCLTVSLTCKHQFDPTLKQLLWDYFQKRDVNDYHDLRSNFRFLCEAVGGFPRFVSRDGSADATAGVARAAGWSPTPTPFEVQEDGSGDTATSTIRIVLSRETVAAMSPAGTA